MNHKRLIYSKVSWIVLSFIYSLNKIWNVLESPLKSFLIRSLYLKSQYLCLAIRHLVHSVPPLNFLHYVLCKCCFYISWYLHSQSIRYHLFQDLSSLYVPLWLCLYIFQLIVDAQDFFDSIWDLLSIRYHAPAHFNQVCPYMHN